MGLNQDIGMEWCSQESEQLEIPTRIRERGSVKARIREQERMKRET